MDELYRWYSQPLPEPDQELAYMYQQEEHTGMHQQPLPEQEGYYTSPPPMMAPNPFHPSHSRCSSFPSFGGSALANLSFGAAAVDKELGQPPAARPPPSFSNNTLSFGGQQVRSRTLNFSGEADGTEGVQQAALERRSRAPLNTQEHVIAERRRREKMQQQFVALTTIIPDLTKTDKVSLLGSTIEYVKQLEEKVKVLEERSTKRTSEPIVFESKYGISTHNDTTDPSASAMVGSSPTVEASIYDDTVLLKICCKEKRGVLVMVISEIENQDLSIINTSVLPFTDSCLNITITAKIGEGFSTTVELVKNLTTALSDFP